MLLLALFTHASTVTLDSERRRPSWTRGGGGRPSSFVQIVANATHQVDTFLGTGGSGHTFPGAAVPWGMVQATPWCHQLSDAADWHTAAGFPPGEKPLIFYGMAHSALSGAGTGELGELRLRPLSSGGGAASYLTPAFASASPGYFTARVGAKHDPAGVVIESSVTPRGAIHRFTFQRGHDCSVELDLSAVPNAYWGYRLGDYSLEVTSDRRLEGCSSSVVEGIGGAISLLCFAIEFDRAFTHRGGPVASPKLVLTFPGAGEGFQVVASVGVSRTDKLHAAAALAGELGGRTFEDVRDRAQAMWDDALGVVQVQIEPPERKAMFYTALYHAMLFPSLFSNDDGSFRIKAGGKPTPRHTHNRHVGLGDVDKEMPLRNGTGQYSTFSLWDTYRGLHPLINILHPKHASKFGESLIAFAAAYGDLPPWQLLASPTDMMDGDGGSIVLATMARQGLLDKDRVVDVLSRVRLQAQNGEAKYLNTLGYIPAREEHAASKGLEQAMADSCVSYLANDTGRAAMARRFRDRADAVFREWNPKSSLFEPIRSVVGGAVELSGPGIDGYTEGTPLQYSFGAPFDVGKLAALHGGAEGLACHLDYFLNEAPVPKTGNPNIDEGNIHGISVSNEPCMHIPYLYSLVGYPSHTQRAVDTIVKRLFHKAADGLPGNDDLGQMSSWLIFSMLGLYPVDPCSNAYTLGRPFVSGAQLRVRGGTFAIDVHNQSDANMYVERARWLGRDVDMRRPTIAYDDIVAGGRLEIWMTSEDRGPAPRCRGHGSGR